MNTTAKTAAKLALFGTASTFGYFYLSDSKALFHSIVAMPIIHLLDPEQSHILAIQAAKYHIIPRDKRPDSKQLEVKLFGRTISNPIGTYAAHHLGLAAGFDKNGEAIDGMYGLGFGMVEIGSVTPNPQPGNPKPRMFRLVQDEAVINRYGFNSQGHAAVVDRLKKRARNYLSSLGLAYSETVLPKSLHENRLLGVNLGKNKTSPADSNQDYVDGVTTLGQFAGYFRLT